ncbi:type IV conjugative transfer system lipoprotein TraV [Pasteurella multocida]|uniref:type IV conjugative transfer system lipoprotein TraV n=1 Tax=Pasteurella multocida TaxID=747 RepID=UPI00147F1B8D|nr:type IV conjugative transfer system lipoprotein TraV [Pasteurella multocida]NNH97766.1 type IV conjugative transfer system protein TraV [Pasteurella multocida]NNI42891.1 type IV conjugative transfer system protein TraV [Pasteurella multocida]
MNKKILLLSLSIFLTGCAGMNTEFEHAIPAKDSGYWLQQADEMTNPNSAGSAAGKKSGLNVTNMTLSNSSQFDITQYKLINLPNILLNVKSAEETKYKNIGGRIASIEIKETKVKQPFPKTQAVLEQEFNASRICNTQYCYPEPNSPFRESERVARVWIAPHVAPNNDAHLGEVVYFVTKPSKWFGVEEK